jgi:His/Glu/Gln/Arg/opine family amino acid ABC transporter permease subunit
MIQGLINWLDALGPRLYRAFIEGDRWKLYLDGLATTLELTVVALIAGVILGVLVAVIRTAHDQQRPGRPKNPLLWILNLICKIYTTVIRGTPMMVQVLIWGFVIFASSRNKFMVGVVALGINSGAYVAEIVRGGLMSVDIGQTEAGRSLGLNYLDTMRFIVIPQAFKNILPSLGNEFITLFKDTSLVNAIGLTELTYRASRIAGNTFDYMPPYIGIAIMYLVVVIILTWLQGKLERRLRQSDRR